MDADKAPEPHWVWMPSLGDEEGFTYGWCSSDERSAGYGYTPDAARKDWHRNRSVSMPTYTVSTLGRFPGEIEPSWTTLWMGTSLLMALYKFVRAKRKGCAMLRWT